MPESDDGGGGGGGEDTSSSVGEGVQEVDDENESEMISGISSTAEIKGECFVRIHNATTGRNLQVREIRKIVGMI